MTVLRQPFSPSPWLSQLATIVQLKHELAGVATYDLQFEDQKLAAGFEFLPGQFNMMYLPGFGESAISISSDPARAGTISHTVRFVGNVTHALSRTQVGDQVGLRGPFGSAWPARTCQGCDILIACGGLGLAPLRPAIYHLIRNRQAYGKVYLIYGARNPKELLYRDEFDSWRQAGIEVEVTVDIGDVSWQGHIGVVPVLFYRLRLDPKATVVWTCGPEIMMRFVIFEALARRIPPDRIWLSVERNMTCAIGFCGHCQLGPAFVCKDGPVFTYERMAPYLRLEDL